MIYETFREAIQNIWSNKFRTFLTMLGIIIGVMAVMVIVGLGNGMTTSIQNEFADMGTNLLTVQIMGYGSRSVKVKDFYELVEKNSDVLGDVSPSISMSGTVKVGTDDDSYSSTSVKGVSEVYLNMDGYTIAQGRPLNYVDMDANKKVCMVGDYISRVGYGGNAIGQSIKIGREWYTIVGVLEAEIDDPSDQEGSSDDCIFVPYTTAMRVSGISTASSYAVLVSDEENISKGKAIIENGLQELLHSDSGYMVISLSEMLEMMTSMVNMVVTVLTAIAAISLLVGGIGIMNIMLVSVTERTREIGIRKSLGAKRKDIRRQFVIEAGTTSAIGGLLGIGLGYLLATGVGSILGASLSAQMNGATFSAAPTPGAVLISFSVSVGIGILFGYLPANKAAKLNPIDALRYD